jgi:hypothetical protein
MNLRQIEDALGLVNMTPELSAGASKDIAGGYCSDLLSDVLAHAPRGGVLVTIQVHMNVVAVAVHAELAAVILASGRIPDEEVCRTAVKEGVALYSSSQCAFDVVGQLYALGLRGTHE